MTERQQEVRNFIVSFITANGFAPTVREIASHFKVQVYAIQGLLDRLAAQGVITWNPRQARTIRVLPQVGSSGTPPKPTPNERRKSRISKSTA